MATARGGGSASRGKGGAAKEPGDVAGGPRCEAMDELLVFIPADIGLGRATGIR
jgi:hypothetical protein